MKIYLLLIIAIILSAASAQAQRAVAITIDDLPYVGVPNSLEAAAFVMEEMTAALEQFGASASGFVTGTNVMVEGQVDARFDLLRRWRDGGVHLENHGFAHLSFNETPLRVYLDDVVRGHLLPERILRERADSVRFYRAPFNATGTTPEARQALEAFLAERGVRLAPFTVEHVDYLFNERYGDALLRGDSALARRIGAAYLAQLDSAFAFAEQLSHQTFGRAIPQVFLIHANRINADYLAAMLGRLQARGYRFISLEEALEDAAYATPDVYVGRWGISWLHRWRVGLGLAPRLREEPEPPAWLRKE